MSRDISNGRERRNYVRIETAVPVRFKISWISSGKIYSATTRNISHGGICLEVLQDLDELVETFSSPPQWPTMEVAPLLPDLPAEYVTEAHWITSRLDWVKKPSTQDPVLLFGLDFVEMADSVRKQIYDFAVGQFIRNYNLENVR
jgi:c-di-GMP-binding flagellar brake protein YcgR